MTTLAAVIGRDIAANRPAASIAGRLYYDTTNSILQRDNGSSWDTLTLTGATSFGTPANTYGTPAAGAASTAIRTDAVLPYPTLTAPIEYVMGAAVTLTTAGSYYQGPNGTPAAGSYWCLGRVLFHAGGTGNRGFTARITTGGSVASGILTGGTDLDSNETDAPSASGNEYQCHVSAVVTLNGSTTISLTGSSATATVDTMRRDPQSNTPLTLHRATILTLIRYA